MDIGKRTVTNINDSSSIINEMTKTYIDGYGTRTSSSEGVSAIISESSNNTLWSVTVEGDYNAAAVSAEEYLRGLSRKEKYVNIGNVVFHDNGTTNYAKVSFTNITAAQPSKSKTPEGMSFGEAFLYNIAGVVPERFK
jgi:hypothetical protein